MRRVFSRSAARPPRSFIDDEVEHRKCCGRLVTGSLGNAVFDVPVRYKLPPQ